jgi:4-hydroxy-2-oxoheptanedioate aldolase
MGLVGKATLPQVKEMITKALGMILKTGKAPGLLNFVPADARAWLQAGFSFIAVGADGAIVARRSESLLQEVKSTS